MRKRQIFLYILIALVLGATVLFLVEMTPGSDPGTVPVVLPTLVPDDDAAADATPEPTEQAITVTADNVQVALQTLSRAENYTRTLSVENFWSGGSSSQTIEVAFSNGSTKLAISSGEGSSIRHILISQNEKWIWYSDSQAVYHGASAENDSDRYQTLLSYEDILALPRESIKEAAIISYEGSMCIFVRYTSGAMSYENHAYIDLGSGLLRGLETYDGDTLIYRMSSTEADLSTPDESVFVHP